MKLKSLTLIITLVVILAACAENASPPVSPATQPAAEPVAEVETPAAPTEGAEEPAPAVEPTTEPAEAAAPEATTTITHAMGETEVPANPQRVVTLDMGELDAALTLGIKPVGSVTTFDDGLFPTYLQEQTEGIDVVGTIGAPNLEKILALKPDLILSNKSRDEAIYPLLSEIAPTVMAERLGSVWKDNFQLYAEALGKVNEGEAVIAAYEQRLAELQEAIGSSEEPLTISMVRFIEGGQVRQYHRGSFIGSILDDAGFARPASQQSPDEVWTEVNKELIAELDGDVIFYSVYGAPADSPLADYQTDPLWQQLEAVQNGRVYEVADEYWYVGLGFAAASHIIDDMFHILGDPASAAGVTESAGFPRTVIDGQGREITFESPPQRVMCFYTDCVEGLVGLGLKPAIVPEWFQEFLSFTLMNAPGGLSDVELIPLDDGSPSAEAIAAAAPDLVMVYSQEEAQALADVAPTFVTYPVNSIEDIIENLRRYAQIFGLEAEAEAAIESFMARRTAYSRLAPGDLRVMNVREDSGDLTGGNIRVRSTGSPDCVLLEEIAQCPWVDPQPSGSWDFQTTIEYLLQQDPDVILISTYGGGNIEAMRQQVADDPLWSELSAVKNGRLVIIDDDLTADGIVIATRFLDYVAPALYPDTFPEPLTEARVQEILVGEAGAAATATQDSKAATSTERFPLTVTDVAGHELTLESEPEFIVCLYNGCVADMAFIGVMPDAVTEGVVLGSHPAYFGDAFNEVSTIGEEGDLPNLEELLALKPDLVVGNADAYAATKDFVPLYEQNYTTDTLDLFALDARNFARMFGREAQTEARLAALLDRAEAYGIASGREKSIYFGGPAEEGNAWSLNGGAVSCGFVQPEGQCTSQYSDEWQEVSLEGLLGIDPDVLIIEDHGYTYGEETRAILEKLQDNPLFQELTAFKTGQIHFIERAISRPDDPLVLELWLDTIMPLAYPEIFDGPLTDEEVQEILAEAQEP